MACISQLQICTCLSPPHCRCRSRERRDGRAFWGRQSYYNTTPAPYTWSGPWAPPFIVPGVGVGEWFSITFPAPVYLSSYALSNYDNAPDSWALAGSLDGTTWTVLDNRTAPGWWMNSGYSYVSFTPTVTNVLVKTFLFMPIQIRVRPVSAPANNAHQPPICEPVHACKLRLRALRPVIVFVECLGARFELSCSRDLLLGPVAR